MVDWNRFNPTDFEYDFDNDKLGNHRVTFEEAVECFFSDFEVRRNKTFKDRYQLYGKTIGRYSCKFNETYQTFNSAFSINKLRRIIA